MKILFISQYKWPHIGGVEKHIDLVSEYLIKKGHSISIVSASDIKYPKLKFFGLIYIWFWFLKNIKEIYNSDIVHIHDVFIWYLPFRFLFPFKKVYITFHGWEGKFPIPLKNILNKKIAYLLTNGNICIGKYIEKWYGIKANYITHGAVEKINKNKFKKQKNTIVWLGRKDKDTGYFEFLKWYKNNKNLNVKYLTNSYNIEKYLKSSEYCAPSGYLSFLEAKNFGCKIKTFANNSLKEDYWKEVEKSKIVAWDDIANLYLRLWID